MPLLRRYPKIAFENPVSLAALVALAPTAASAVLLIVAAWTGAWGATPHAPVCSTDFAVFWSVGRLTLQGHAADVYDPGTIHAFVARTFGSSLARLPFFYPPPFVAVIAPLGALSYRSAFAVWTIAMATAYAAAGRLLRLWASAVIVALAAPGVLTCLWLGQSSLWLATTMLVGLTLLRRRPWLAGLILATLACKPQFAILAPIALLAGARWRALSGLATGYVLLIGLSLTLLGPAVFLSFLNVSGELRSAFVAGGWFRWSEVQSVYGFARSAGLQPDAALILHGAVALAVVAGVVALWRSRAPDDLSLAAVAVGGLLVTPYVFFYDEVFLGVGAVFLLRHAEAYGGVTRMQAATAAAAYLLPQAYLISHDLSTSPFCAAAMLLLIGWRAAQPGLPIEEGHLPFPAATSIAA